MDVSTLSEEEVTIQLTGVEVQKLVEMGYECVLSGLTMLLFVGTRIGLEPQFIDMLEAHLKSYGAGLETMNSMKAEIEKQQNTDIGYG